VNDKQAYAEGKQAGNTKPYIHFERSKASLVVISSEAKRSREIWLTRAISAPIFRGLPVNELVNCGNDADQ